MNRKVFLFIYYIIIFIILLAILFFIPEEAFLKNSEVYEELKNRTEKI